jgi:hypothetical protein
MKTKFAHCQRLLFSRELMTLGLKDDVTTDRVIDLLILIGKYTIFLAKLNEAEPCLPSFVRRVKEYFDAEKYITNVNLKTRYARDWLLYKRACD